MRWAVLLVALFATPAFAADVGKELDAINEMVDSLLRRSKALEDQLAPGTGYVDESTATRRYEDYVYMHLIGQHADAAEGFFALVTTGALGDSGMHRDAEWYLADSLYKMGNLTTAEARFQAIVDQPGHSFRDDAVRQILEIYAISGRNEDFTALYEKEILRGKVEATDVVLYSLGKSFHAQDEIEKAQIQFLQVPEESAWYGRSQYYLGALEVQQGKLPESLPYFKIASEVSIETVEDATVRDLALLAGGRVLFEMGQYANSAATYELISGESEYNADKLYELTWAYIKQEKWKEALRAVEIFLIAYPEHAFAAQLKLVEGHLHVSKSEYDSALTAYERVLGEYAPIRDYFGQLEDAEDPSVYLRQLTGEGEFQTLRLPDFAVSKMLEDPDLARAVEILTEIRKQEEDIKESELLIRELTPILANSDSLGGFEEMRYDAVLVANQAAEQSLLLLETEETWLLGELNGPAKSKVYPLQERRLALIGQARDSAYRLEEAREALERHNLKVRRVRRDASDVIQVASEHLEAIIEIRALLADPNVKVTGKMREIVEEDLAYLESELIKASQQLEALDTELGNLTPPDREPSDRPVGKAGREPAGRDRSASAGLLGAPSGQPVGRHVRARGQPAPLPDCGARPTSARRRRTHRRRGVRDGGPAGPIRERGRGGREPEGRVGVEPGEHRSGLGRPDAGRLRTPGGLLHRVVAEGRHGHRRRVLGAEARHGRRDRPGQGREGGPGRRTRAPVRPDRTEVGRMSWVVLLALLNAHAADADALEGPIPDEVAAWRAATERYEARMDELGNDTRAYVALRQVEERAKLVGGYDAVLESLQDVEENQRDVVMARFEEFLTKYPDATYSSHIRFRLADLYYEIASLQFLEKREAYYDLLESTTNVEVLERLKEPYKDLTRPIEMYQRIIDDNRDKPEDEKYERLDGVYLMLGFCFSDDTSAQRDPVLARAVYTELVEELPDSDLADRGHLFLGNFLFEEGDFEGAVAEYTYVFEKGQDGPYYTDAMYQLAWAHYKENRFEEATALFLALLDRSEEIESNTGKQSPFAPDAVKYMAYSFADMAGPDTGTAVDVAKAFFEEEGRREYEWEIYVELAEVLMRYYRFDEAIEAYTHLQADPRWFDRPENPEFQIAVVKLYGRPEVADYVKSGEARLMLTDRYNEGGDWWEANRNNPEALSKARAFIEDSLLDVAIEYYVRATESNNPDHFLIAANKYKEYLEKFPIADDYYDQQWYLANAYRQGGAFEDAEREYTALLKSAKYHPYNDGVLYFLMDMRLRMMETKSGPPDKVPVGGKIVEMKPTKDGGERPVYEVSEDRMAFIEAADQVLAYDFGEPDPNIEGLPDIRTAVEANRTALMYIPAQILFYHGQYDEARKRLIELVDNHTRSIEASYAAGLLVNSYLAEGDLEKVRAFSKRFTLSPPGPIDETQGLDEKFLGTLEGASFKLANQRAQDGDYEGAAEAFLNYLNEFPESEYAADALHNAAFYYQEVGKQGRANELYEDFVKRYPDEERSRGLYFRIAANYEATFELGEAVKYYDELRKRFPDDTNAADALYNASFLRIGIGDHSGAAKGFETYAREYPESTDREQVHWMAGEQYEEVSDGRALIFYQDYLREYETQNPDHAMEATHKIAEIYQRQGRKSAYEKQLDEVMKTFDELAAAGSQIGPLGHKYAAEAAFRDIQAEYEEVITGELQNKGARTDEADSKLLKETKPGEVKEFEGRTKAFIGKYRSFDHNTHALYLQGMAVLYLADLGLSIKPPPGLSEEQTWAFEDLLQEKVFPQYYELEEVGVRKLGELIDAAKKQKRHSEWIDAAYAELNKREPLDYPDLKDEVRGIPDPRIPLPLKPETLPEPTDGLWGSTKDKKGDKE